MSNSWISGETDVATSLQQPEDEITGFREPPNNAEAEMGLLGVILENNLAYEKVSEFLRPEHFFDPLHGRIFDAVSKLVDRGQQANPTTLKHVFDAEEYKEIGGHRYLANLAGATFAVINAQDYGRLIYDLYLRRQLIELGTDVVNHAYSHDPEDSATLQIEGAEQYLYDLATSGDYEGGFKSFAESIRDAVDMAAIAFNRDGALGGVPTKFRQLDLLLGGLHKSDLIVLAGRPAMGKTALATNIAFNVANLSDTIVDENGNETPIDDPVVGFFSLEMSSEQLASRILAEGAQIPSDKIRKGELNQTEFDRLVQTSQKLQKAPLYIDDTPALSVSALRTRARRLKRQIGLGLIVVDYLQLLQGSNRSRDQNRVQEISEITRGLKTLAKELDVPVIALSQLSRAVEQREDKRPQLADLRESGTIEQDADVVMFIYRDEYYLQRAEPSRRADESTEKMNERYILWEEAMTAVRGRAEVIIAKQRHGPTGTVHLRFYPEATKFDNLEDGENFNDPNGLDDGPRPPAGAVPF
ncbi:MAG: Replicative DNA helicase [Alphaproteobacteria bacterium MarineAlpha11_Bin1]|nr:MAG: Replicative DNA helicase [Alphaproteobacteria bacterium MarineAlpha11_Bin1]|tara:strand:- start:953 stop:2536 length:1584 start_codon:yes stop_codon:yes gene_type:complete